MSTSEAMSGVALHAADRDRILLERARRLAEKTLDDGLEDRVEVLLCRVRNEHYAVQLNVLRSVHRPQALTPVPRAASQVAGVLNVRGELVTVLDLAAALGLPGAVPIVRGEVLLIELSYARVGILVDEVLGVEWLSLDQLDPALPGPTSSRGIARGSMVLLNLEQLMTEQGFEQAGGE